MTDVLWEMSGWSKMECYQRGCSAGWRTGVIYGAVFAGGGCCLVAAVTRWLL